MGFKGVSTTTTNKTFLGAYNGFVGVQVEVPNYFVIKVVDQFGVVVKDADVVVSDNNDVKDTLNLVTDEDGLARFVSEGWTDFDITANAECYQEASQRFQDSDSQPFTLTLQAFISEGLFIDPINYYNFVRWHRALGLSFPINNPPAFIEQRNQCQSLQFEQAQIPEQYPPIMQPGERFSFFCNVKQSNLLVNTANIVKDQASISTSSDKVWKLKIVDCDFNIKYTFNLETITKTNSTTLGTFYAQFEVPVLDVGGYYLVIDNETDNQIEYVSNEIQVVPENRKKRQTKRLRYNNDSDIYDFYYERLEEVLTAKDKPNPLGEKFINEVRIDMALRQPQANEELEGYRKSDGTFKRVFSNIKSTREAVTIFLDEEAHRAFFAATHHDNFMINNEQYHNTDEDGYNIEWQQNEKLAGGSIRLEQNKYYKQNRNC